MTDIAKQDVLWAGISGIPFSANITKGQFRKQFDGTLSLFGKIPSTENIVNFSALNSVLSKESLNSSNRDIEEIPQRCCEKSLDINDRLLGTRCELKGRLIFRDPKDRNFESFIHLRYTIDSGVGEFKAVLTAKGITACPCSMEKIRKILIKKYPEHSKSVEELPQITHNQRVSISIETIFSETHIGCLEEILKICELSIGNLLSHNQSDSDVNEMLLSAHESPLLIEDIAKRGSTAIKDRYGTDRTIKKARIVCESEESIHSYNARSEKEILF